MDRRYCLRSLNSSRPVLWSSRVDRWTAPFACLSLYSTARLGGRRFNVEFKSSQTGKKSKRSQRPSTWLFSPLTLSSMPPCPGTSLSSSAISPKSSSSFFQNRNGWKRSPGSSAESIRRSRFQSGNESRIQGGGFHLFDTDEVLGTRAIRIDLHSNAGFRGWIDRFDVESDLSLMSRKT